MTISQAFDAALQRHQAGRLDDAEALYRRVLAAGSSHADTWHLLGVIAHQRGRYDAAVESIRKAIAINPAGLRYYLNLGNALLALGRGEEAMASYKRALQLRADYSEVQNNPAGAPRERGHLDEAIAQYRRAIEAKPDDSEAHHNLGAALAARGQFDEAIEAYRRALELKPDYPVALNNLGNALSERGRFDEAASVFRRALELKPSYPVSRNNPGGAPRDGGRLDQAVAEYRQAIKQNPDLADAHYNLGIALGNLAPIDEVVAAYRRALELKPDHAEALNNLGNALKDQGQLDESIAAYRQAFQIKPDRAGPYSNLIFALHLHPRRDAELISEEHQRWNRRFSDPVKQFIQPHANDRRAERRLRIGYVSPDFREHPVGRCVLPMFERHDREQFEIICYSEAASPDSMTERFRAMASGWRNTVGVSDAQVAEMIRADGVDILVDLAQHTGDNRLPVFARHPAPVQVTWLGYPGSAGLPAIAYRISDQYLESGAANERAGMSEGICLIDSFWCYAPCGVEVEVNALPVSESGTVTFGCLNNFCKINDRVLDLWARVLTKVDNSCLVLTSRAGSHREQTVEAFESRGVGRHRVEFVEYRPLREYLERYHRIDIVLDTFPYNGGVTTCDALWMGAPVVSLAGEAPVSRGGMSVLTNLGLPELLAHSEEDYVRIAIGLAGDLPRLEELRATLRDRMKRSVLMDAPRLTRQIEQAYRGMWQAWCETKDEG